MKMMKRTLCLVLALVMLVGMFTVGASAAEAVTITLKANGGVFADGCDTAKVLCKTQVAYEKQSLPEPTKVGFIFEGWTYPSGKTAKHYVLDTDHELTANWKEDPDYVAEVPAEPTTVEVTFDYAGGKDASDNTSSKVTLELKKSYSNQSDLFPVPTKDGYDFVSWTITGAPDFKTMDHWVYEEPHTLVANWEEVVEDEPEQVPPTMMPLTPAVGTRIKNAVTVDCDNKFHDSKTYDYVIGKDSTPTVRKEADGKWYADYPVDANYYADEYSEDLWHKHSATTRIAEKVTLVLTRHGWKLFDGAEIDVTCGHDYCGGWFHKHTVTYTDGVKNATVFKDITYEVKHGAKTPVPADPVRAGYKFAGWTPAVSAKTTKCVTYTATWTAVKAPALTTKHVAYLKGYGGGIVKPEGEITRAEAITMLYRLMDAASVKEYYTSYNAFTDVAKDAWYNDAVSTLANAGVLRYKTGLLNPNEKITRAEFFYMLTKFSNATYTGKATFVDVPVSYWAYEELALAQYLGWIKGYGGGILYPDDTITRAEVAASLNRVLGRTDCKTKDTKNYSDNPVNAWYYQDIVEASIAH